MDVLLNLVCIHYMAPDCLIKSAPGPLMVTLCFLKSPHGLFLYRREILRPWKYFFREPRMFWFKYFWKSFYFKKCTWSKNHPRAFALLPKNPKTSEMEESLFKEPIRIWIFFGEVFIIINIWATLYTCKWFPQLFLSLSQ